MLPNTNYCRRQQILLSSDWQITLIYFDENTISNLNISFNSDNQYIQHDDNLDFHLIFISYFIFLWFISEYMNHMMLQKMIKYNISNTWNKDMIYYRYALEKIIKF